MLRFLQCAGRALMRPAALMLALTLGAALAPAQAANNLGLPTIPLVIQNNSGHAGKLFVYITGLVPQDGNKAYYVSATNGDVTVVPKADQPVSLALDLGRTQVARLNLPQMTALRIYMSFRKPVVVIATAEGAPPSSPPGWVPDDPNYGVLFDFAEFTWTAHDNTIGGNATQVDMFGLAMLLALKGKDDHGQPVIRRAGFNDPEARTKIFAALNDAGPPWKRLVIGNRRIIAPYHGIALGRFGQNQLNAYINAVWTKYRTQTLQATTEGRNYTGKVIGGRLVFEEVGGSETFSFAKPTTMEAYQNALTPDPNPPGPGPGARARAVAAMLSGAFMRTTLLLNRNLIDDRASCKVRQFYTDSPVNLYAKTFHEFALRKLAYSFGFDDTCQQSSFVQVHDPESLRIIIQPLQ